MRVPAYNEQMRYDTRQKGGRINGLQYSGQVAYENNARFGKALSGLAGTLARVSDEVYATNMKINEADATKALTQYQKEFLAKQTEIQQLKGEQALHASEDFAQWQSQRKQELTKDLSPVAMGMFEQKAGVTFESNRQWVSEYQQQEETRYEDGVFQAHVDTLKDTYLQNINSPKLMRESQDQVFAAIQEFCNRKGLGQEVAKNMYKNTMEGIAKSGVELLIDNSDLGKARALLQHNSVYLSPDVQANLKKRISNEQERLNAKAQVQQFNNQVNGLVGNGSEFIFQNINNMSKEELLLEADKISKQGGSYEIQEKVYNRLKGIIDNEEEKKENRNTVFVNNLLNSPNTPEENVAVIQDAASKGLILNDTANNLTEIVLKKDVKTTDWIAYNEVQQNISNGVYANLDDFIKKTKDIRVTYKDRQELQKDFENRYNPIQKKFTTDKNDALALINPKPKNPTGEQQANYENKQEIVASLFEYYKNDFVQTNGRLPNRVECNTIAFNISQELQTNGSFSQQFMTAANEYAEETGRSLSADNLRENAENLLFSNGIPETKENLLRVMQAKDMNLEIEAIKNGRPSTSEKNETEISLLNVDDIITE